MSICWGRLQTIYFVVLRRQKWECAYSHIKTFLQKINDLGLVAYNLPD
jgi:hypothetical protein